MQPMQPTAPFPKPAPQDNPFDLHRGFPMWLAALTGIAVGLIYGLAGFIILKAANGPNMGGTLFLLLPFIVGATIAMVTPRAFSTVTVLSASISLLICLLCLVTLHLEGILCAVLAFPLIFVPLCIGAAIGMALRKMIRPFEGAATHALVLLAGPLLLFGGNHLEANQFANLRTQNVTTTVHLPAKPEQVWSDIQSLDSLSGRKPFLMHIGLPVPQRCVLQGTSVGSKRICYFDQGSIEESVLEWDPPRKMRLAIDRTNMPGRHWLAFDGAEYDLTADATGTTITRTTTIRSTLRPAWYWAPFEKWGVQSEHNYLFSDLAARFSAH